MTPKENLNKSSLALTHPEKRIYQELTQECMNNPPRVPLSPRLTKALERMHSGARSKVVEHKHFGCTPLMLACKRGNVDVVKYLVHACGANVEHCGADVDHHELNVTPLWSAAAAGHLSVVRLLADAGANLNATASYSGSTPVSAACQNNEYDVVMFLFYRGADINRPDNDGGTCLMKSVDCAELCYFLINRVSNINACNINKETALHLSVRRKNIDTTIMLLKNGADPHVCSKEGDDALQLACLVGDASTVDLLIERIYYLPERRADSYELLAAILLEKYNNVEEALSIWREALVLRSQYELPKRPELAPRPVLQSMREFRTDAELEVAATDEHDLHTQALLVFERVLSSRDRHHRVFSEQLMIRGLEYANAFHYQRCVNLWTWALEVRIHDSLMDSQNKICVTARELTRLFQDIHASRPANSRFLRFQDVFHVFSLLVDTLLTARGAFGVTADTSCTCNKFKRVQEAVFDCFLIFIMHLLHLLLTIVEEAKLKEEKGKHWAQILHEKLCWLVAQDVRNVMITGNTLLHFSVSKLNFIRSVYFSNEQVPDDQFPSLRCVRALLAAGASPNERNFAGYSPLYIAAHPEDFNNEIVVELLKAGAHIDQPDGHGRTPMAILAENADAKIPLMKFRSLACLAASVIVRHRINPGELPKTLLPFVQLHHHE